MHQANGVQRCFETQTKYAKSPAGWRKGRVTRAHGGRRKQRSNNIAQTRLCAPKTLQYRVLEHLHGESSGSNPGPETPWWD